CVSHPTGVSVTHRHPVLRTFSLPQSTEAVVKTLRTGCPSTPRAGLNFARSRRVLQKLTSRRGLPVGVVASQPVTAPFSPTSKLNCASRARQYGSAQRPDASDG